MDVSWYLSTLIDCRPWVFIFSCKNVAVTKAIYESGGIAGILDEEIACDWIIGADWRSFHVDKADPCTLLQSHVLNNFSGLPASYSGLLQLLPHDLPLTVVGPPLQGPDNRKNESQQRNYSVGVFKGSGCYQDSDDCGNDYGSKSNNSPIQRFWCGATLLIAAPRVCLLRV